ncbi:hypothetical protein [Streptomyces sp. NPDC048643]|uniref:hypothetical protein n=1 Tax=Streptomyces sp. NPDC048643 TaxID=3155637 RepID=UPI0034432409
MFKRAKDVTYTDRLVTEAGIMDVRTVATDMIAFTTMIGNADDTLIYGAYEQVETLDD